MSKAGGMQPSPLRCASSEALSGKSERQFKSLDRVKPDLNNGK